MINIFGIFGKNWLICPPQQHPPKPCEVCAINILWPVITTIPFGLPLPTNVQKNIILFDSSTIFSLSILNSF